MSKDPVIIEQMVENLRNGNAELCAASANALEEIGTSLAIPALIQAAGDPCSSVRGNAMSALEKIH